MPDVFLVKCGRGPYYDRSSMNRLLTLPRASPKIPHRTSGKAACENTLGLSLTQ
jgi:hypothetical protein